MMRTAGYTMLALTAFAANSVLCRLALRDGAIDPASFSTVRFATGALTLLAMAALTRERSASSEGSWLSAVVLFIYAVPFAFAYLSLAAGTGALILFGCVQLTMMAAALVAGERPHLQQWAGLAVALAGLVVLVLPGVTAPPLAGAALMAVAGVFWGLYSLRGRGAAHPLAQNSSNFVRVVPLVAAVNVMNVPWLHVEARGVWLAAASGALASGLGYVVWYSALRRLSATRAAVVQLAVPVIAAAGGVILLGESVTMRLLGSTVMVLGGIWLALSRRERVIERRV